MKLNGFTLLEALITLAILSVLTLICFSSGSFLIHKNEGQIIRDEIETAIQYAKIQAISLGRPVALSPLDKEQNWSKGMKLTLENNKDILYQWQWHHPLWNIMWSGAHSANKITISNSAVTAISNGKFALSNSYSRQNITIILNRLGRVRWVEK